MKKSPIIRNVTFRSKLKTMGLSLENVALRGVMLKNTDWIFGVAVYTGEDTKMSRNSKITRNKFSTGLLLRPFSIF